MKRNGWKSAEMVQNGESDMFKLFLVVAGAAESAPRDAIQFDDASRQGG